MLEKRIRVRAIGRLDILPETVVTAIRAAEAATARYDSTTLTIAAAYGGREEIVDAVCKLLKARAKQGASATPSPAISMPRFAGARPDHSDERGNPFVRFSALAKCAQRNFYFTDVAWPAFRKIDFLRAIRAYQGRNRRFGR
jgi:short-chain Z-isoprenyl diphosphate synthase